MKEVLEWLNVLLIPIFAMLLQFQFRLTKVETLVTLVVSGQVNINPHSKKDSP